MLRDRLCEFVEKETPQIDSNYRHKFTQISNRTNDPANLLERIFFVKTESSRDESMVGDKMKNEVQPRRGEIIKTDIMTNTSSQLNTHELFY
jgi:hypothetical protein